MNHGNKKSSRTTFLFLESSQTAARKVELQASSCQEGRAGATMERQRRCPGRQRTMGTLGHHGILWVRDRLHFCKVCGRSSLVHIQGDEVGDDGRTDIWKAISEHFWDLECGELLAQKSPLRIFDHLHNCTNEPFDPATLTLPPTTQKYKQYS